MARPPLPIGTWGSVTVTRTVGGWRARARYRDTDGVTRTYSRTRSGKAAARDALTEYLRDKADSAGSGQITRDSTVAELLEAWWEEKHGGIAENSRRRYRTTIDSHLLPRLAHVRLHEATTGRLDRTVKLIAADVGAESGRQARNVLRQAFGLAVRLDALAADPAAGIAPVRVESKDPRALTAEESRRLLDAAAAWETQPRKSSRPWKREIRTTILVMLGTGLRIGELLALRWGDLDLEADVPTLTVSGTIVGGKRQERTKARRSERTVYLPAFATNALRQWRDSRELIFEPVFPSSSGAWWDTSNYAARFREVRDLAGLPEVTTHNLRKTVATALDAQHGTQAAADQLGHGSVAVTTKHYLDKINAGPREVVDVMDAFLAPRGSAA